MDGAAESPAGLSGADASSGALDGGPVIDTGVPQVPQNRCPADSPAWHTRQDVSALELSSGTALLGWQGDGELAATLRGLASLAARATLRTNLPGSPVTS